MLAPNMSHPVGNHSEPQDGAQSAGCTPASCAWSLLSCPVLPLSSLPGSLFPQLAAEPALSSLGIIFSPPCPIAEPVSSLAPHHQVTTVLGPGMSFREGPRSHHSQPWNCCAICRRRDTPFFVRVLELKKPNLGQLGAPLWRGVRETTPAQEHGAQQGPGGGSDPRSCCASSCPSLDESVNYFSFPPCVYFCHLQLTVLIKSGDEAL